MSNKNLSRTGNSRADRQIGEAPAIGKVSRSREFVFDTRSRSRSRRSRKQGSNRALLAWTALFSVVAIGIIATVIFFFYNWNSTPNSSSNSGMPLTPDIDAAFLDINSRELPSLSEESAKKMVKESLAITDPALIDDHFIVHSDQESVISALVETAKSEGDISSMEWLGQIYSNNRVHNAIVVIREKNDKKTSRVTQIFKGDDDKWRIDFDSYMRTTTPSWEEILTRRTANSVVRVFVSKYNYYNGIYSDDQIWQSYSIVSPDISDIIYGYIKKGTAQEIALTKIISNSQQISRVTLGLLNQEDAGERQFEISRVYAEDWALSAEAYDESF